MNHLQIIACTFESNRWLLKFAGGTHACLLQGLRGLHPLGDCGRRVAQDRRPRNRPDVSAYVTQSRCLGVVLFNSGLQLQTQSSSIFGEYLHL
ncbi:hypothetical protein CEXT_647961 [Caerostris extrusa]|uniref:Ycf15 n=1 Tax=Caerostris extrusa TaxID=172846 RepID=A0AAV4PWS9_CAEEX|nr:hypothetical protein CEXT_647961 [Caerostris extrusa]